MKRPWKCVVCEGSGVVTSGGLTSSASLTKACHACGGSGVLWGDDDHGAGAPVPAPYPWAWPPHYGPWWQIPPVVTYCDGNGGGADHGDMEYEDHAGRVHRVRR